MEDDGVATFQSRHPLVSRAALHVVGRYTLSQDWQITSPMLRYRLEFDRHVVISISNCQNPKHFLSNIKLNPSNPMSTHLLIWVLFWNPIVRNFRVLFLLLYSSENSSKIYSHVMENISNMCDAMQPLMISSNFFPKLIEKQIIFQYKYHINSFPKYKTKNKFRYYGN